MDRRRQGDLQPLRRRPGHRPRRGDDLLLDPLGFSGAARRRLAAHPARQLPRDLPEHRRHPPAGGAGAGGRFDRQCASQLALQPRQRNSRAGDRARARLLFGDGSDGSGDERSRVDQSREAGPGLPLESRGADRPHRTPRGAGPDRVPGRGCRRAAVRQHRGGGGLLDADVDPDRLHALADRSGGPAPGVRNRLLPQATPEDSPRRPLAPLGSPGRRCRDPPLVPGLARLHRVRLALRLLRQDLRHPRRSDLAADLALARQSRVRHRCALQCRDQARPGRAFVTPPLGIDLGNSFESFRHGAEEFFHRLSDIAWLSMSIALVFYLAHLLARSRGWQNTLRAAYPEREVPFWRITAAYLVGAGMNSIVPARIGDAVKIFLAKRSIRRSSYPTVVSSFFVGSVLDTTAGISVFVYALTQGLLPQPPELPDLPAFDIAFWAQHPSLLLFTLTALAIATVVIFALLARRVEAFWDRVKQGAIVLATPALYLKTVASWQGAGWGLRFFSYWFFLEAFHIGGSFQNVLLVMSVQTVATLLPLTPGGAGAQQALLVATLVGPGPIAVLTYSVGQQIAVAAWTVVLGALALIFVFRTTNWRSLIRSASQEAERQAEA